MKNLKSLLMLLVVVAVYACFAADAAATSPITGNVVTIYNHTSVHLNYQLRVMPKYGKNPEWGKWQDFHHSHPNNGWYPHNFDSEDISRIEIQFDRIGGDGEYTEKVYSLEFNKVRKFGKITHRDGRAYCFKFDAGGRLLNLTTHNW